MQLTERTTYTHTQPFNGILSGTTRVGWYQKKHSLIYTHADHQTSFINFLHLLRSIASSLLNLRAWQSFPQPLSKSSLVFLFLSWTLSSYSMYFFTRSSSFCNTCPYYHRPFWCNTNAMSSLPTERTKPLKFLQCLHLIPEGIHTYTRSTALCPGLPG